MMKRFFTAMLGSLAAIWISIILISLLGFIVMAGIIGAAIRDNVPNPVGEKSILYIDLDTYITEVAPNVTMEDFLYGNTDPVLKLQPAIDAIRAAETDRRIKGIFINASIVESGAASLKSLHDALLHFKENSGKWIVAYGEQVSQGAYYVSALSDEFYINPEGMLDIHGLTASVWFYKGLFEKLGIEYEVVKVGTFKSAVEPFILDSISPASRMQMQQYMDAIWNNLSATMAQDRGLTQENINGMADSMLLSVAPAQLVKMGLADQTLYRHEVEENLRSKIGLDADAKLPFVSIDNYYDEMSVKLKPKAKDKIAVLYAQGSISEDGKEGIIANKMVPLILELSRKDEIKAMVLRVNSPGGSAYASEQIWEALEQFKATGKPLYVSMGDYAASGGYYISCGADKIYASPVTLTGSIGIYGLIPNFKGLLNDHLGIHVSHVATNKNSDFPAVTAPMTPFQHAAMQQYVNRGYETFVSRVAHGRDISVDSVKVIAEGRVWAGVTALSIGLVDELGSLNQAIEDIAVKADLTNYDLDIYPRPKEGFWDMFNSLSSDLTSTVMRKAMGEHAYEIYRRAKRMEEVDRMQCVMEDCEVTL